MADHPSSEKRNRQRIVQVPRETARYSAVRSIVKRVHAAIETKDGAAAKKALVDATVALGRAASKGVFHQKAASRVVSRLSSAVHKLGVKA